MARIRGSCRSWRDQRFVQVILRWWCWRFNTRAIAWSIQYTDTTLTNFLPPRFGACNIKLTHFVERRRWLVCAPRLKLKEVRLLRGAILVRATTRDYAGRWSDMHHLQYVHF